MIDIEEIYKNISEYDITEQNALNCLFQGDKNDISHFYFRSMLLQLLKNNEHLDRIIQLYYKLERGAIFDIYYNVNNNGSIERKNEYDILQESKQRLFEVYSKFERGDYEELKKILSWADTLSSQLSIADPYEVNIFDESLMKPIKELDTLKDQVKSIRKKINENEEQDNDNKKEISESKTLTVIREKSDEITVFTKYKRFLVIRYYIEKMRRKYENKKLKQELQDLERKKDEKLIELKQIFSNKGLDILYEEMYSRYQYYNEEISMNDIVYGYTFGINKIKNDLSKFFSDVYASSKTIQNQMNVLRKIKDGGSLKDVCNVIREGLGKFKNIEIGLRDEELCLENDRFTSNSTLVKDLLIEFEKLEDEYKTIMNEKDDETFVRRCADFHFNFLRVHPFSDGNGRTSRILLSTMLGSRNIFFPSLYISNEIKSDFYKRSNDALKGIYETTQNDLIHRLGHFYPMILPNHSNETNGEHTEKEDMIR